MFRHTYCSARLATLDRGAPVSPDTVSREMGHSSRDLVEHVYGHPGRAPRCRGEAVEQHEAGLGDRLQAIRGGLGPLLAPRLAPGPLKLREVKAVKGYIGAVCPRSSDG